MRKKEKLEQIEILLDEGLITSEVIDNLNNTDITGMLESVNYTNLEDGIYLGHINFNESLVIVDSKGKKDPYVFDFGWTPGFKSVSKITSKIIVKDRKGYISCKTFTRVKDYLDRSVSSKEREIKFLEDTKSKRPDDDELLDRLKKEIIEQKKSLSYIQIKYPAILKNVKEKYEKELSESKSLSSEIRKLNHRVTKELSAESKEMKKAKSELTKKRKLSVLSNYRTSKYKYILNILLNVEDSES